MKPSLLACLCLSAGSLIAPTHAAPEIDSDAPVTAEDLGITKWVPKLPEDKTKRLIVTVKITQTKLDKVELHTSRAVFDLDAASKCFLLTYRSSLFGGNSNHCTVRFGKWRNPSSSRGLDLTENVDQHEETYTPNATTIVRHIDGGNYRIDYMVEEVSREELKAIAGDAPEGQNGEKLGTDDLKEPRPVPPDPEPRK
ncbi:hypothetical protein [Luteolibacter soli]|uniref:Uncharacterized protein n=1 Tax=Luteolibacter soli TaxID=3135280 RepID=A0ABU9AVE5_9BACT